MGVGNTCLALFMASFTFGANRAQDHLTTAAYGKGDLRLCGIYLNRGRAIQMTFFIPLCLVFVLVSKELVKVITDDEAIVEYTVYFMINMLPAYLFIGLADLQKKWLLRMRIVHVPMYPNIITAVIHIPIVYVFTFVFEWDLFGICAANWVSWFIVLALMIA